MNLEAVFRDFEAQLDAQKQIEIESSARDEYRAEFQKIQMSDRLAAQRGQQISVSILNGTRTWLGTLTSVGYGWIQIAERQDILVPTSQITWWESENRYSFQEPSEVSRKLSFAFALRALARHRLTVRIFLGERLETKGVLERVGADFVEINMHPDFSSDAYRKGTVRIVPLQQIVAVAV